MEIVYTERTQNLNEIKTIIRNELIKFSDTYQLNLSQESIASTTIEISENYLTFRSNIKSLYMNSPEPPSDKIKLNRYKLSACLVAAVIANLPFTYYKELGESDRRHISFYYYNEIFAFILGLTLLRMFFIDSLPEYPPQEKTDIVVKILQSFPAPFTVNEELTAMLLLSLSEYSKKAYENKQNKKDPSELNFDFMLYSLVFEHLEEAFNEIKDSIQRNQKSNEHVNSRHVKGRPAP